MPIKPLYDRVAVRPGDGSKTDSGIVIAGSKNQTRGQVVAVGAGHVLQNGDQKALTVQIGDLVEFDPRAGHPVVVDGEELLIFSEDSLLGVVS